MPAALAASLIDRLLRSALGAAGDRVATEGLALQGKEGGALEIRIRRLEAASLHVASGPVVLELGKLSLDNLVALVRVDGGRLHLSTLEATGAELSGVKVHAPVAVPLHASADGNAGQQATAWSLGPLAAAQGTIRAQIVDAHLLFDADVTVPIRGGRIDFKDATVEHVGPDSRMGISRLGIHVDAPNGRSYLYQFSSPPLAGVEYEQRGALPGPWVTNRGSLQLQPFTEWLLRQPLGGPGQGVTEQARLLFGRTAVSGDVQLSDGRVVAPGVQADLAGAAEGRNMVRLHSPAVGRGLTAAMASLSVRQAILGAGATRIECDQAAGALTLQLAVDGAKWSLALDVAALKVSGIRLRLQHP